MKLRLLSPLFVVAILLSAVIALLRPSPALAALGWVGGMFPAGGSANSLTEGGAFDVYVQVYKGGVTEPAGQGADISCTLYWGEVPAFGGTWFNIISTSMSYNTDIGNNDEYQGTITPSAGLYEFTAYCTDLTDGTDTWQGDGNGRLTVNAAPGGLTDARALWVEEAIIAWDSFGAASYELHHDPAGNLAVPATAGSGIALTFDGALTAASYAKFPNVAGYDAWRIPAGGLSLVPDILKSEMAIAAYDGGGALVDATRLQIQGVLDDLYSTSGPLGVSYNAGAPTLRLWAPTAVSVSLHRFADPTTAVSATVPMSLDPASGVWSVAGDASWDRDYYLYEVELFVPETGQIEHNLVTDPYSLNLSPNSQRSQIIDLADADLKPAGWDGLTKPSLAAPEDIVVYEVHVRDFSINDTSVLTGTDRGTFRAFTYDGVRNPLSDGMSHLLDLAAAGLSHVHLLPAFDIASVNEDPAQRQAPDPALLATYPPSSTLQQEAISNTRQLDAFNWGYDPYHYGVPEGSYATAQDDASRVLEFRQMVQALNENGLRVVMDVVYNHTNASGQDPTSVLDQIVPGYYHRYDNAGNLRNSSCCADTAAEFDMMQKLMVDTVVLWATAYKVDGFRFDLMNLHTVDNVTAVRDAVQALTPAADGVDGGDIYLYGEGWSFGSALEKGLPYANQLNVAGTGVGTFNDKIRDAAHGGYSQDPLDIRTQGFINGLSYDWNGYSYPNRFQGDLRYQQDRIRVGLAGNLQNFPFIDQNDNAQTGAGLNGTGYTLDPQEHVPYVSKHDNETLYDQNVFKLPAGVTMADRVRAQNMGLSVVAFSQGVPFFHLGSDMLRSKSLDRNSYDSGDWFNRVDFTYQDNNFGVGLPPAWDNQSRWAIMAPPLADAALVPAQADILDSVAHLQEVLQIRAGSPLFRLQTESEIISRVDFHNTGSSQLDGLIVMSLSDGVGADLDPNYEYIVVLFNANDAAQNFTMPSLAGLPVTLHPALAASHDPVVQTAAFDTPSGQFTIPARTTAVFVSTQAPSAPGNIDWVGSMFPVGGASTAVPQGDATGLTVYVQVYEPGVTDQSGQGAGIDCFLHWGRYGDAWTDLPMSYNVDIGNNDEYMVTIPTGGLSIGAYGFTAYCSDDGGVSKTWRAPADGGDGILSITPTADQATSPTGGVFVHLFEWPWPDVARECEEWLGPKGFTAVQVSPPNEHGVFAASGYPWWQRYQPVGYELESRSGTRAEFIDMVSRCQAAGVGIYVDAVINHMTGLPAGQTATGSGGTQYREFQYPYPSEALYGPADFHAASGSCPTASGEIEDYGVRTQVQNCELLGLADLNTGLTAVEADIAAYLNDLLTIGVAGFRLDASKHMFAADVEQLLGNLNGSPYVFQEVIDAFGEPVKEYEYFYNGDVTEFSYSNNLGAAFSDSCAGKLADLQTFGGAAEFMDGQFAVVFSDNHDNQRGHGSANPCIVTHQDGLPLYRLANVFMLAWPYGYPKVMSSFYFSDDDQGPPGTGGSTLPVYDGTEPPGALPARCDGSNWVCEQRDTAVANMVAFRQETAGQPVTDWWDNGNDAIAFGRNGTGFVVINREASPLGAAEATFATGLPPGDYCDVVEGEPTPTGCSGQTITVNASGNATINVAAMDAAAIHTGALAAVPTAVATAGSTVDDGGGVGGTAVAVAGLALLGTLVGLGLLRRGTSTGNDGE